MLTVVHAGLDMRRWRKDAGRCDREAVRARLARPPDREWTHPESGRSRALSAGPALPHPPTGPRVRVIIATHPATCTTPPLGGPRGAWVSERLVPTRPHHACVPTDGRDRSRHRGSGETVRAEEDLAHDPDRWCSHPPMDRRSGTSSAHGSGSFAWNSASSGLPHLSPPVEDGSPHWARPSFPGGCPGSAGLLQPDGTLLCPAHQFLSPQERRPERAGSSRRFSAARPGDGRAGERRATCPESPSPVKPRRIRAVIFPPISPPQVPSAPVLVPPQPLPLPTLPVLWGEWPRGRMRRNGLRVIRSATVVVPMGAPPPHAPTPGTREHVRTRTERAPGRLPWHQRLASQARPSTASHVTRTLHGLPALFAHRSGCGFLEAASMLISELSWGLGRAPGERNRRVPFSGCGL